MTPTTWTTTCDIHRPFGDGSPRFADIPCRLVPDLAAGIRAGGVFSWTHYLDLPADADIQDGCTRDEKSQDLTFNAGDEVRVPAGGSTRYVVVWVEQHNRCGPTEFRRAYLLRHEVIWPDV